jgi:DNA-binding NtrC family response regulator
VIVASSKRLEERDLAANIRAAVQAQLIREKPQTLAQLEAVYIAEMLAATKGNKSECARVLGISRKNLYEKIARYNLEGESTGLSSFAE